MADITVGRRKTAVARVRLLPGVGNIIINKRKLEEYFGRKDYHYTVKQPLIVTSTQEVYDVIANVKGGGTTGQADAIKLGIARALLVLNPKYKQVLRQNGLLTRDSREVERKKYGRPKARKRFQFSKR